MPVRYEWYNAEKSVMRYIAEGDWNWHDYHRTVRVSLFAMMNHPHAVHSLIDLRASGRATLPAGFGAHARTFGKRGTPALSGKAIVLGVTPEQIPPNILDADGTLETPDGRVYFAQSEDEARALLQSWGANLRTD
ncbi:MAG: hypothetical protein SNJ54_05975 [Anaerolineae bacterium]|jgi:hypothetical protein